MFRLARRIGKYISTAANNKFEEKADPKIQLTQAIEEAQDQHRKLKQQAAAVIAHQKQTELRLNRKMTELEQTTNSARHAVMLADEAAAAGDTAKLNEYTGVAETLAGRMVSIEEYVESLKELHYQTTQGADQAKAAVSQNAFALQKKLTERQKLLSQLDQAKMQEQLNSAMTALSEKVGQDVPSLDQVRNKIEERYAKALGAAELVDQDNELQVMQMEQAARHAEARARLGALREQLHLGAGESAAGELSTPQSDPEEFAEVVDEPAKAEEPAKVKKPRQTKKPES